MACTIGRGSGGSTSIVAFAMVVAAALTLRAEASPVGSAQAADPQSPQSPESPAPGRALFGLLAEEFGPFPIMIQPQIVETAPAPVPSPAPKKPDWKIVPFMTTTVPQLESATQSPQTLAPAPVPAPKDYASDKQEGPWNVEPVPFYSWIWADAAERPAPLDIGHGGVEPEETRWSAWLSRKAALEDMQLYHTDDNLGRPVELRVAASVKGSKDELLPGSQRFLSRFRSLDAAMRYLERGGASLAAAGPATAPSHAEGEDQARQEQRQSQAGAAAAPRPSGASASLFDGAAPSAADLPQPTAVGAAPVDSPPQQLPLPPTLPPTPSPADVAAVETQAKAELELQTEQLKDRAGGEGGAMSWSSRLGYLGYFGFLPCFAVAGWLAWRTMQEGSRQVAVEEEDEESSGCEGVDGNCSPNPWQAFMGAPREGEMRRLLFYAEQHGPLALPPLPAAGSPGFAMVTPAQRAGAEAEAERVLSLARPREIFASRDAAGRSLEFQRLLQLLHPDSGLVPRDRAVPALRRVVEAYRAASADVGSHALVAVANH